MNDPLQLLLQQAADAVSPFAANSRYRGVPTATVTTADGRTVTCVTRRFVPQVTSQAVTALHTVGPGDRLDRLADQYLGDPELFWRLCDANYVLRPADLTDDPPDPEHPRVLRVGLPAGVPAPTPARG